MSVGLVCLLSTVSISFWFSLQLMYRENVAGNLHEIKFIVLWCLWTKYIFTEIATMGDKSAFRIPLHDITNLKQTLVGCTLLISC